MIDFWDPASDLSGDRLVLSCTFWATVLSAVDLGGIFALYV